MRHLYSALFFLALPFLFVRLWWKGRKNPEYRLRWSERLGYIPTVSASHSLWLHAVSMGEMIAAKPLISALRQQYPDLTIVITTTTLSGSLMARQLVGEKICHYYSPYDTAFAINRFLDRAKPIYAIVMETELWPNLFHYTAKRHIPILLANARLSESSMRSYSKMIELTRPMLAHVSCIAAQTQADADRFIQIGANPTQIQVMGNVKFDVPIPLALIQKGRAWRDKFIAPVAEKHRQTIIAASTHLGEEEIILSAFDRLLKTHPHTLLILVPRHAERTNIVLQQCEQKGYRVIRRTQNQICSQQTQIFLGDTMGELFLYYAMADLAFVGGSLCPIGGHNPLEPAALSLPVVTGTHVFNFAQIFKQFQDAAAAVMVIDEVQLKDIWAKLLDDTAYRKQMGAAGKKVVAENRGAVAKHLAYVGSSISC